MNNINQNYNKYFNTYKKQYDNEKVKDKEKRGPDYQQFEITDNGDQEPKKRDQDKKNLIKYKSHYELN